MNSVKKRLRPSLPGVRRIFCVRCADLPEMMMIASICGSPVAVARDILKQVPFAGNPSFGREGVVMGGGRAMKCSLEFRSDMELDTSAHHAFVVELVNGTAFIIGTREPNFPVVECEDTAGAPGGDPAVRSYKITHTDIKSGIPVIL